LFHSPKIYLSRYALCLVIQNFLRESDSFKNDLSENLFTNQTNLNDTDFKNEMILIFAGYYFSSPHTDIDDLTNTVWTWIRGKRLKNAYESVLEELETIVRGAYGKKFTYHVFEEFKQEFIFDILFKQPGLGTFKNQYENALKSFGYELSSDKNDNIKWTKNNKIAPKYPGGFFAPQITFLLTWSIKKFCEFEENEFDSKIHDRIKWLNNLTKNFFYVVKEGLSVEQYKYKTTKHDFSCA
jgi:hypothetical protein